MTATTTTPTNVIDGGQPVADIPWSNAAEIALSPFGKSAGLNAPCNDIIAIGGQTIPNVRHMYAQNWRGIGLGPAWTGGRILDSIASRCYVGAKAPSSDYEIGHCRLFNNRDVGLWVAANAGNVYSHANHCYGARIAVYNEGGMGFRSELDTLADALVGALLNAESRFDIGTWQHNTVRDIIVRGGDTCFTNCIVNAQLETKDQNEFNVPGLPYFTGKIGVQVDGDFCSFVGCKLDICNYIHNANIPSGRAATGFWINASNFQFVDGWLIDSDGLDGTKGIVVGGQVHDLKVDSRVRGFSGSTDKALSFAPNASCDGLDVTLIVDKPTKPLADYVSRGKFTGCVRVLDSSKHLTPYSISQ